MLEALAAAGLLLVAVWLAETAACLISIRRHGRLDRAQPRPFAGPRPASGSKSWIGAPGSWSGRGISPADRAPGPFPTASTVAARALPFSAARAPDPRLAPRNGPTATDDRRSGSNACLSLSTTNPERRIDTPTKLSSLSTALTGLVIAAGAQLAGAQISFKPAVDVAVGPQPDATAIADFNGDGLLDLAVANDAPDKVSFLFNQGNGTFGAPVHVQVGGGTSPHTPVAADFDGDGDMDAAVSLHNAGSVRLLVNQGGGNFTLGASFGVGSEPRSMVAADFDNDGRPDMAVSNRSSNNVSVLRNLGGLSFSVASFAAGLEPREIDAGDMTGDGLPDIAVAAHDSRQIVVLRSLGNGSFAQHTVLNMSSVRPEGVAVADLDGDGTRDIAASVGEPQLAAVWLNTGGGSFGGAAFYPLNGLDASSIVAADLDLDGDMDLATSNTDSNNVSVLANQGGGTFGGAQLLAVGSQPGHIATGDLDKNGSPDLVTANDGSGNVSVLLNQKSGGSSCATQIYCQAKVNSAGGVAQIGSSGTPSAAAGNFSVNVSGALPGKPTIAFFGTNGPANQPFMGGTLCVTPPLTRLPVQFLSATGSASYFIQVTPAMAGTMRWYQFWYRDPQHPDGTGSGLSNALEVRFCD